MAESSNPEPCPIYKEDIDNGSEVSTIGQNLLMGSMQQGLKEVIASWLRLELRCTQIAVNAAQTHSKLKEN